MYRNFIFKKWHNDTSLDVVYFFMLYCILIFAVLNNNFIILGDLWVIYVVLHFYFSTFLFM